MRYFIFILTLFFVLNTRAQVYPKNNVSLNHLQLMFQYPQFKDADQYEIKVYQIITSPPVIKLIYENKDSSTAHLLDTKLEFNSKYKWNYSALKNGKAIFTSEDFFFGTANTNLVFNFKSNITKHDSSKVEKGLICLDNGVIIDRNGKLVLITDSFGIEKRDFVLTNTGSLTYVLGKNAYDISINGDIIWRTKQINTGKEIINEYHHDVTKLSNGNYLVMCKVNEQNNPKFRTRYNEAIVELTPENKIVWLWKENDHIGDTIAVPHTHLNSIFLDEAKDELYVSGRDLNTVFIIDRKTGKIKKCIGYKLNNETEHYTQLNFNGQHSAQLLSNGNLLLFNNNTAPNRGKISSVIEINIPVPEYRDVENRFIYFYDFGRADLNLCPKGGDANKLKNGNYLISSSAYNRNFEITSNGEIVWECRPEKMDSLGINWVETGSYRINFSKDLYPSFYTLEKVYKNNKIAGFKICNKGSEDDEYTLQVLDMQGKLIKKSSIKLESHKNLCFYEVLKPNYSIKVIPKSNPANIKQLKFN